MCTHAPRAAQQSSPSEWDQAELKFRYIDPETTPIHANFTKTPHWTNIISNFTFQPHYNLSLSSILACLNCFKTIKYLQILFIGNISCNQIDFWGP